MNFSATINKAATLTPLTLPGGRVAIVTEDGAAVAVVYTEGESSVYAETDSIGRYCHTIAEAVFFVAATLVGEWEPVSSGAVASPLARVA